MARSVEHVAHLNNGDAGTPAPERREAASSWSRAMALAQDDGNVDDVQPRPEFSLPRGGTPPSFLSSVMAFDRGGGDGREFWSLLVGLRRLPFLSSVMASACGGCDGREF